MKRIKIRWEALGSLILAMTIITSVFYIVEGVSARSVVEEKVEDIGTLSVVQSDVGTWSDPPAAFLAVNRITHTANATTLVNGTLYDISNFTARETIFGDYDMTIWIRTGLDLLEVYNKGVERIALEIETFTSANLIAWSIQATGTYPDDTALEASGGSNMGPPGTSGGSIRADICREWVLESLAVNTDAELVICVHILSFEVPETIMLSNATYTYQVRIVPSGLMFGAVGVALIVIAIYSTEIVSVAGTMDAIDRLKSRRRRRR